MSCELLQQIVDKGTASLAAVKQAPVNSQAQARGEAAIQEITDAAQAALSEAQAVPDGTLAAVSGDTRTNLLQALVGLQELALAESVAAMGGNAAAFGDGTFLRLFLEYLPMLLELLKQFL